MDFSQALQAMKNGAMVSRPHEWCGGGHGVAIGLTERPGTRPFIALRLKTGGISPWMPQQFDLLAEDWEIVETTEDNDLLVKVMR